MYTSFEATTLPSPESTISSGSLISACFEERPKRHCEYFSSTATPGQSSALLVGVPTTFHAPSNMVRGVSKVLTPSWDMKVSSETVSAATGRNSINRVKKRSINEIGGGEVTNWVNTLQTTHISMGTAKNRVLSCKKTVLFVFVFVVVFVFFSV